MVASKKQVVNDILFHSFYENGSVNFVIKQDNKKDKRLKTLLEYSYFQAEQFGEIFLSQDHKSCAIVIDSQKKKTSLKSVWWDLKLAVRSIGITRLAKVMKREKAIKKHHPKFPFIHLWYIGVTPNVQGKGKGSKLMSEIESWAANQNKPIFLETSMPENFHFYERLGFKRFKTVDVGYDLVFFLKNPK